MKKLRPGNTRLRLHGNKNEAQKLRTFAMRKLQGFLSTCDESMQICGPWKIKFEDGSECVVQQVFDVPIVDIFVPYPVVHVPEKVFLLERKDIVREKLLKIESEGWRFVPAFCLQDANESGLGFLPRFNDGFVAICSTPSWESLFDSPKEKVWFPDDHGEYTSESSSRDSPYSHERGGEDYEDEVLALQVVGGTCSGDFSVDWDLLVDNEEDTGFMPGPLPYFGYSYATSSEGGAGSLDHMLQFLFQGGTAWASGSGHLNNPWCGPNCQTEGGCLGTGRWMNLRDDGSWTSSSLRGVSAFPWIDYDNPWHRYVAAVQQSTLIRIPEYEGYTVSYISCSSGGTSWTCTTDQVRTERIYQAIRCGRGHLFAEFYIVKDQERRGKDATCAYSIDGMCLEPWYCIDKGLEFLGHVKRGDKQERQRHYEYKSNMNFAINLHSGETVEFAQRMEEDSNSSRYATAYLEGCKKTEYRTSNWNHKFFEIWQGAHVSPELGSKSKSLEDAWFLLYLVAEYKHNWVRDCDNWGLSGYGYNEEGEYSLGSWGTPSDCEDSEELYVKKLSLYANVMGEEVLLDETEWGDARYPSQIERTWYEIVEAQIFDYFGVPVFMYGYVLWRISPTDWGDVTIDHIRYGYFMGTVENHVRSEKFYPSDMKSSSMHDVFDLSQKRNLYAFGRCCGFAIKNKNTLEV